MKAFLITFIAKKCSTGTSISTAAFFQCLNNDATLNRYFLDKIISQYQNFGLKKIQV